MKAHRYFVSLICGLLILGGVAARQKKVTIGSQSESFTFKDIHYLPRTLDDLGRAKAYVIAFTTTSCPLTERYLPRLKELSAEFAPQGVRFIALDVCPDDSLKEIAFQALDHGLEFPFAKDFDGQCVRALGATRTPEVVVLDGERKIRYRGRIDNQYRLGGVKPSVDRHDLKEAIQDVLA